jgi:hypothetical protein
LPICLGMIGRRKDLSYSQLAAYSLEKLSSTTE